MGFIDTTKRVDLGDGEWVDVRPLSVDALRELRQKASLVEPGPGEEIGEARGYELTKMVLNACIVAWSDPAPVSPENVAKVPYAISFRIANGVGLGGEETPLPNG